MADISSLAVYRPQPVKEDWLIKKPKAKAAVWRNEAGDSVILSNGLVERAIKLSPNAATVSIDHLVTGEKFVRAVRPEAIVEIDGKQFNIGGLYGQPDMAYLTPEWTKHLKADANDFQFESLEVGKTEKRMEWKQVRHTGNTQWPAPGASLTLWFGAPKLLGKDIKVGVHYEIYDGMPMMRKWITIENRSGQTVRINRFISETLATVEPESYVEFMAEWLRPNLSIITDYTFGGSGDTDNNQVVYWKPDPTYGTQVNYELKTPCLLEVRPPFGPDVDLKKGETLASFNSFELVHDSWDRERKALGIRQLFRTMAPWSTENPLMLHLTSIDPKTAKTAIDQASECGFEMVILSFGSGLNMEDTSAKNVERFKELREYAKSKGLELGGYSLLASRRIDDVNDAINPKTGKTGGAIFGNSPCLLSKWGLDYFYNIEAFIKGTGFNLLEHDGSYPGDRCASTTHPGHRDAGDSQWLQFQKIAAFYRWCRSQGIYLNVPDNYHLAGSNKTGMGYRETNWSLPREQQHIHCRQNLFDGTWYKTPSMGWTFVPLVEYQGGGAAATIEPLREHLADYEQHLANNLGWGAQACYRGPRLYDTPETKAAVVKWVAWFKKYRAILESDVIHVKRSDGNNLDVALHVNPALDIKAMAVVYNPLHTELEQEIVLPLYYSGLTEKCHVSVEGGKPVQKSLSRAYELRVKVKVAPYSRKWLTITP